MKTAPLVLTRTQILEFRRRVGALDERLPAGARSLRPAAWAGLLPSGDAYYLLYGSDRELLVPDAAARSALWTSRVWPGAVLVGGEIVGTWRRAHHNVSIESWRRLSRSARDAVEAEAASLPLPDVARSVVVRWT